MAMSGTLADTGVGVREFSEFPLLPRCITRFHLLQWNIIRALASFRMFLKNTKKADTFTESSTSSNLDGYDEFIFFGFF